MDDPREPRVREAEETILDLHGILEQIAGMRLVSDDKVNRFTLSAAITLARGALGRKD